MCDVSYVLLLERADREYSAVLLAAAMHGGDVTHPRDELDVWLEAPLTTERATPDAELRSALGV